MNLKKTITSGKRKRAVARAVLTEGNGKIIIEGIDYNQMQLFEKLKIQEPIKIAEHILGKANFDAVIFVRGGGVKGQTEAARLALAKGNKFFKESS